MSKPRIAISIGDPNGVGIEIALKAHEEVKKLCTPVYCIGERMLAQAASLLDTHIPNDFNIRTIDGEFTITPGRVSKESGKYSYDSFLSAVELAKNGQCEAITTLPIHKEAWEKAGVPYKGHTDMLRDLFKQEAIMMLGCEAMYVALYTEHIPLKEVAKKVKKEPLARFLLDFYNSVHPDKVAVLGLNPHAGDNGVLGSEEREIEAAITAANKQIGEAIYEGPLVPDIAFTPASRKHYSRFVAMYHDQGLIPLKALYFDESVNISLNLPIVRTSVDHGTAFDIAYKNRAKTLSYVNAVQAAITLSKAES